ncbi:MAG: CRTAC1 family protein [Acidobacteriota bacterium]|nr:CRTAC1 family protein [Acidobacteriota bacterium]
MVRFLLILAAFCLYAPAADQPESNRKMAKILAELSTAVGIEKDIYANDERAENLDKLVAEDPANPKTARYKPMLAVELLRSGKTREAIAMMKTVKKELENANRFFYQQKMWYLKNLSLAWMRLGEQENCLDNHTSASCLLPIQGEGVHRRREGSQNAIGVLEQILKIDAENLRARWLMNIAYMTLGEYPDKVPAQWLIPPEAFQSGYEMKRFTDIAANIGVDKDSLAGGVIVEDFNGDGLLDILCSSWSLKDQIHYLENDGKGGFVDKTAASGLTGITGGLNMIQADADNDGNTDILVLRGAWRARQGHYPNSLLKSHGNGRFTDVTEAAGLLSYHPTQTATWLDVNNDGWIDLFIGNETQAGDTHACELFMNNGDGTFRESAVEYGLAYRGFVKGTASGDIDNDGWTDLFISRLDGFNLLYKNMPHPSGEAGKRIFKDISLEAGIGPPGASFPTWFFDMDNDGDQDLYVADYFIEDVGEVAADYLGKAKTSEKARLYRNKGDGTFEDISEAAGIHVITLAMGANFGDLDNDGFLDFYVGSGRPALDTLMPNRMFRNNGKGGFDDVTTSGGFGHLQKGHGVSFVDLDRDGDQDVYAVMGGAFSGDNYRNALFENPNAGNRWIILKLEGVQTNRGAIGARIQVTVTEAGKSREIHRTVRSGGSFGASPLRQHIGLGKAAGIQDISIYWPVTGKTQKLGVLEMDKAYHVIEGKPASAMPYSPTPFQKKAASGHHHH